MTGTRQNRRVGFRPLLQQFVVEPDRFDYGTLLSASPLAIKIGGMIFAAEM